MDAATVENVKWMMTYLNDCKESNVGQLFMAVQTYVWENQSYKGEPGGDGDAGGYANADTYELYLSLIDSLLAKKAAEDAEFQRQIEEYKAQGIEASIVEDESAKWAVFAISSNRKNQSFFNYYGPRKLVTGEPAPDQPEQPTGGTGKIVLKKTAGGTTTGLAGARFSIYFNGQIVGSDITNAQGEIYVEDAATGLWSFVETSAPDGFCVDPTPKSVYVDVTEGDREYTVAAINYEKPDMKIIKRDAMSGKPIAGAVFSVKSVTGSYSTSVTTGTDGSATLSAIPAGVYVVREESVPEPYIVTNTEQTVALRPGKTSEVTFVDYEKPGLEILKKNIANGEPIEGVTYRIEQIDGSFSTSATTDNHGRIFLESIPVGSYKVTEINVPSHVILCPIPQEVALKPGETSTVTFFNALKPSLEIRKVDSVTGDSVKGAKFQIWYASNHTDTVNKLVDAGFAQNQAEAGALIARAVSAAAERAEEVQTILGAWSDAPGDMRKTDANAALLERVRDSKTLQDISRYLGRFREIFAQGKRNGYAYGRGEKYALELGNDLSRALTSELAMLAVPETLPLFLRKYQHRQIKQYRRREPVYKGAGDIICCLDESGSTAGDLAAWGKAVALTLLEIAQSEGRKFALVHFSGPGRFQTDVFLPGQSSLEEKLHAAETFLGGGTDFQTPLAEAERLMREGGFENADIAFITDGECSLPETCVEMLQKAQSELRFTVTGILLDEGNAGMDFSLKPFCQNIYRTSELTGDQIVGEIVLDRV